MIYLWNHKTPLASLTLLQLLKHFIITSNEDKGIYKCLISLFCKRFSFEIHMTFVLHICFSCSNLRRKYTFSSLPKRVIFSEHISLLYDFIAQSDIHCKYEANLNAKTRNIFCTNCIRI